MGKGRRQRELRKRQTTTRAVERPQSKAQQILQTMHMLDNLPINSLTGDVIYPQATKESNE